MEPKKIKFTHEVEIADVDGVAICAGSVLRSIDEGDPSRGVVIRIIEEGKPSGWFAMTGDLEIRTSCGVTRGSNRYAHWQHIPREEQTYEERHLAWVVSYRYGIDGDNGGESKDEKMAIDGVMSLLPKDPVDWEQGPWPDSFDDALRFMRKHLAELTNQKLIL